MRILILAPVAPFPLDTGAAIHNFGILRHLAGRHDVSLLVYGDPGKVDTVRALEQVGASVHIVPPPRARLEKRRAQLGSLFSIASYMARSFRSAAMQAAIDRLLAEERFDIVLVEHSQMALFDFPPGPALVVHEHNIEYELLFRTSGVERSLTRKLFNWLESAKFRPDEIRVWKRSDGLVMMSERECRIVDHLVPSKPTTYMPCGVDLESLRPNTEAVEPGTIIFTGTMDYRPNADAVVYFAGEILPRIVRECPQARFLVVGRNPPDEIMRLAGPNLTLSANVPHVRPYLARAAVVVVPMRIGAGARLKVTEALAMGKAIVSTTLGCEGHPVEPGEQALIVDDAAGFAAAVVRVLRDPALGAALGERARALAERSYGWPVLLDRLETFLIRIAKAHTGPALSPVATLGLASAGEGGSGGR